MDRAARVPAVGVEQAPGRTVARLPHFEPVLAAVAVSEHNDPSDASPFPWWGERARVGVVTRSFPPIGRRRLLLNPKVPVDCPLLRVDGLGKAAQKHCCSGDVLTSPSELWELVPLVHDVVLDLTGVTR